MNQNNAITTRQQGISLDNWQAMRQQAEVLVQSGFLPKDINTPEKAIAVMMTGAELQIPPMQALRQITIIQGKPTVSPELMAALVERDYGSNALIVEESTHERCVVSCLKPGWDKRRSIAFTILDAQRAKLASDTWSKYPVAMLRSRAISIACKTYFQASIGGMYTGEELGASVTVDEDGGVTVVDASGEPPIRSIVDVLTDELDAPPVDEFALIERTEILQTLREVDDRRDLAGIKARLRAAGLDDDAEVTSSYNAAYERLTGKTAQRTASAPNDAQPALSVGS